MCQNKFTNEKAQNQEESRWLVDTDTVLCAICCENIIKENISFASFKPYYKTKEFLNSDKIINIFILI